VTVAPTPPPSIVSFAGSPGTLGSSGGTVQLVADVEYATSCVFKSAPSVPRTPVAIPCANGNAATSVTLPPNAAKKAKSYTFSLTAAGVGPDAHSQPVTVNVAAARTVDTTPPGPVTYLAATASPTGIQLSWNNPTDTDFASVTIRRAVGTTPPATDTDGTLVATVPTPGQSFVDDGIDNTGATYSYSLFALDNAGNVSLAASITVQSIDSTPPGSVTDLTAATSADGIQLAWSNPSDSDFAGVVIRRAEGSTAPSSPTDGASVTTTDATTSTFDDTEAMTGNTYTYAVFAADDSGNYAAAATITYALPTPAETHVCGSLAGNTTWSPARSAVYIVDCSIDIPAGVTLSLDPGTIVKAGGGAKFTVEGSLDGLGTSADPVVLTSVKDSSVGGATGVGSPAAGDWGGIAVSGVGSVDLEYATIAYAQTALSSSSADTGQPPTGPVVLNHDTVRSSLYCSTVDAPAPTVTDNSFVDTPSYPYQTGGCALEVGSPSLDLGRLGNNSASGTAAGPSVLLLTGTVGVSSTLPAEPMPWGISIYQLDVPAGVTATIGPGAVVKSWGLNGCFNGRVSCQITVEGTLDVAGTAADPVVLTSVKDSSVGGATGVGSPAAGDWGGIAVSGVGSVDLEYATIAYAQVGIDAETLGTVTIDNDSFSSNITAVDVVASVSADQLTSTNAAVHNNWFDQNTVAMAGDSVWLGAETQVTLGGVTATIGCHFFPEMFAGGNRFGPDASTTPFFAPEDYDAIQVALAVASTTTSPNDWTDGIDAGPSDVVTFHAEACLELPDLESSHAVIASAFDFTQN
jgi:hypothetical protein